MEIVVLAVSALIFWVLISYVLGPIATKRLAISDLSSRAGRAAMAAAVQSLSSIAFWFMVSSAIAAAIATYFTKIQVSNLGEADAALQRVRSVTQMIEGISSNTGLLALGLAALGVLIWTYRQVHSDTSAQLAEDMEREIKIVVQSFEDGTAQDREPSPAMQEISEEIGGYEGFLTTFEESTEGEISPEDEAALREKIATEIAQLMVLSHQLDIYRRAEERIEVAPVPPQGLGKRISTLFISEGLMNTLSSGLRVVAALATLATVPASLSLVGPLALDQLEKKSFALDEEARNFRFALEKAKINQAFDEAAGETNPAPDPPSSVDEQIADEIARDYESDLGSSLWTQGGKQAVRQLARVASRERIRSQIINRTAERSRAVSAAGKPSSAIVNNPMLRQTSALLNRSAATSKPVTHIGRRAAQENRRIAREHPQLWSKLKINYANYRRSFGRVAPPQKIYGLAISHALGESLGTFSGDTSFFTDQARRFGATASSDAAGSYFEASYKKFVVEAAKTGKFGAAAAESGRLAVHAFPAAHVEALADLAEAMPAERLLERNMHAQRNTLKVTAFRGDFDKVQKTAQRYAATAGGRLGEGALDALASFGDFFPGFQGEEQSTRLAKTARAAKLRNAPPAVGRESARYLNKSARVFSRAKSYAGLRGFSRVGGVLIGRESINNKPIKVDKFKWLEQNGEFSFWIAAGGRPEKHFGPYSSAVANLALAYAADGRPTTVTMVSAEPLIELKILTHPALIDTGLGCRARRLDQFVDGISRGEANLTRMRKFETEMAKGEVALYRYARAVQLVSMAKNPTARNRISVLEPEVLIQEAVREIDPLLNNKSRNILAAKRAAAVDLPLTILSKPAYFDRGLSQRIASCLPAENLSGFGDCIRNMTEAASPAALALENDNWLAPSPNHQSWSGVRELEYVVDPDFDFLMPKQDEPLWPFRFMVQLALKGPPFFAPSNLPWHSPDNTAIESYVDPNPWEFERTSDMLGPVVAQGVENSPERKAVLHNMTEFVILQRLFRAAIDGPLSDSFPMEELLKIDEATAGRVNRNAQTLRWNVRPGATENIFLQQLKKYRGVAKSVSSCANFIFSSAKGLSNISPADWDAKCGAKIFDTPGLGDLRSFAERISVIRALRSDLDVAADETLLEKLYLKGCPKP